MIYRVTVCQCADAICWCSYVYCALAARTVLVLVSSPGYAFAIYLYPTRYSYMYALFIYALNTFSVFLILYHATTLGNALPNVSPMTSRRGSLNNPLNFLTLPLLLSLLSHFNSSGQLNTVRLSSAIETMHSLMRYRQLLATPLRKSFTPITARPTFKPFLCVRPIHCSSAMSGVSKACCQIPPIVAQGYKGKGEYKTINGLKTCKKHIPGML